ncbi:TonB-dependent receptor plug domain-containing protein [Sphingomonas quercus]|uniref:TonB-dependent receptor n=1 Tax=Sphingomonas quercus TaxID=2842451 RepID=A0ABS6BHU4_9SPHN|nr:TonB-dependent receptor [Sphingomonas quercus]MBU3077885.1 TonB-dependent receptor [Sphingomonas quercus]
MTYPVCPSELILRNTRHGHATRQFALATVGLVALSIASTSAFAQDVAPPSPAAADAGPASGGEIVVTGSRITRSGFSAPTPTTVVGIAEIERKAEPNIFNVVNQIPALAGSAATSTGTTSSSAGTNGRSTLNLRGLGANRTLVLLDGQRVIGVDTTGGTDISQFPQGLIQRVDVVTGGASASWGSDAVAGVVNFILDHNFSGIKGNVSAGETTYGDGRNFNLQLTAGTSFADGRGHIEASGEYAYNSGVGGPAANRDWYRGWKLIRYPIGRVPAGSPLNIASPNVSNFLLAPGAIITNTSNPAARGLIDTTFGAGGSLARLQRGWVPIDATGAQVSPWMIGGDQNSDEGGVADLDTRLNRQTFYGRVSYDFSDFINVYATYNFARVYTNNIAFLSTYKPGNLTVHCNNPFLPAGISAACGTANDTLTVGTMNVDLPSIQVENIRKMYRWTFGGDGKFNLLGTEWKWDGYYTIGLNHITNNNIGQTLTNLYNAAIDAVPGPNGTVMCRNTVAQGQGCQPYNIFGTGVGDPSAARYFSGTAWLKTRLRQDAASLSFNGEPFSTWAGPVSLAFGGEYRREAFRQQADPCSYTQCNNPLLLAENNWFSGNFHPSRGTFNVKEGFVEVLAPLLKGEKTGDFDLNLGARYASYSSSGGVWTWKAGITYAPPIVPGLRFRGIASRDIRAPNLNDLYAAASTPTGGVVGRFGSVTNNVIVKNPTLSNPDLKPEVSRTYEAGVVYQPDWLPGLSVSVDYYQLSLKDAIGTIGAQQEMDLCADTGNPTLCNLIQYWTTAGGASDPNGSPTLPVSQVTNQPPAVVAVAKINLAKVYTNGIDIEVAYTKNLSDIFDNVPGTISFRGLATNTLHYKNDPGLPGQPITDIAGQNSGSIAKWRLNVSQTYANDRWDFTLTERWFSSGVIDNSYIECQSSCPVATATAQTINDNHMPGALYLDIAGTYNIFKREDGRRLAAYFKITNLLDKAPAPNPSFGSLPISNGTNPTLYDTLGRRFVIGARFEL